MMTDKRYKLVYDEDNSILGISDDFENSILFNLDKEKWMIIDRLNEQEELIESLKKSNKDYDDAINEISDILREAYEEGVSNPYLKRIGKVKVENR